MAALGDTYANASPDPWDALDHAVATARTLNRRQRDLRAALLAAAGLGNTGAAVFARGGPYLARGASDLVTSSQPLDEYSPEIFCTIRNYHDVAPKIYADLGNDGYSLGAPSGGAIAGAPNPHIYPENLPRTNARGGPGGRPGCWQTITRELRPAPMLVMDTGATSLHATTWKSAHRSSSTTCGAAHRVTTPSTPNRRNDKRIPASTRMLAAALRLNMT